MPDGDKLANSVILILLSRFAMIFAAGSLPIAGWMLNRSIATVDHISLKVDQLRDQLIDTNSTMRLMQQTQQVQNSVINDHETRMRGLERRAN